LEGGYVLGRIDLATILVAAEMEPRATGEPLRNMRQESRILGPARAIMQLEIRPCLQQPLRHAEDRRYPDAPGVEQRAPRGMGEAEIVARRADTKNPAWWRPIVDRRRTAAGFVLP